jgi:hypothetical protein
MLALRAVLADLVAVRRSVALVAAALPHPLVRETLAAAGMRPELVAAVVLPQLDRRVQPKTPVTVVLDQAVALLVPLLPEAAAAAAAVAKITHILGEWVVLAAVVMAG